MRGRQTLVVCVLAMTSWSCARGEITPVAHAHDVTIVTSPDSTTPPTLHFVLTTNNDPTRLVSVTDAAGRPLGLLATARANRGDLAFDPASPLVFAGKMTAASSIGPGTAALPLTFHLEPMGAVHAEARVISAP